jgi:hypothetical protein
MTAFNVSWNCSIWELDKTGAGGSATGTTSWISAGWSLNDWSLNDWIRNNLFVKLHVVCMYKSSWNKSIGAIFGGSIECSKQETR